MILVILFFSCKKENTFFDKNNNLDNLLIKVKQSNNKNYKLKIADSVYKLLANKVLDSVVRDKYLTLAEIFVSLNDKKYVDISNLLISNPTVLINHKEISYCNSLLANYYYNIADYEKSYLYFNKAENSYQKLNDIESISYIILSKANILTLKKDYVGAEKLAIKALKIAKKNKNYLQIYNCYITIGYYLVGLENYEKALQYFLKALNLNENLKSDSNYLTYKLQTLNYIATVYQKQKSYREASETAKKALSIIYTKNNQIYIYCYLKNTKAYSKFKLGDKNSDKDFLETLKIGDSLKFAPIQITSKNYLGEYYLAQKDTLNANSYLKDAQNLAHKNNIFEDELKILQLLAKANPNDKSFYSNRYIALNDSLQTVERATRDKFARIEFETDEITAEKNTLNIEKNQVSMQRYLIAGISLLSLLIVFLWYRNKLQKAKTRELLLQQEQQKANEEIYQLMLDQQQKIEEGKNIEKQRISQELHDGVMGRLSAIRMNLFVLNKKTDPETIAKCLEYIKEIQNIEKEIRTISHDLNNNMFSDNIHFESIVKNLFTSIQNHSDIEFLLKVDEKINWETLPNSTKISIYRIIQEALQNIEKYARASHVAIQMEQQDNCIEIEIKDDGIGFKINTKNNGIGITNMQARMQELHGDFKIASQPNKGTKINLTIPI